VGITSLLRLNPGHVSDPILQKQRLVGVRFLTGLILHGFLTLKVHPDDLAATNRVLEWGFPLFMDPIRFGHWPGHIFC
jgi:hypothetical protein